MSLQSADRTERTANTPRGRTRHGCWTCRKRRRKCDEQKPRCQNCMAKGLKCQYGLQLTFHEANHFKLMPDDARALSEHTHGRYKSVQFIDGREDIQEDLGSERREDQVRESDTFRMSSPRVDAQRDQVRDVQQATDVTSPRSSNTIDSQSRLPEEADYEVAQTAFDPHDLVDVLRQENSTSHTSSFRIPQNPRDELSSGDKERAMGHRYAPSFSPTIASDGDRQPTYAFTLQPNSSFPIEGPVSSSADRANPTAHPTNVISRHSPTTARELMKLFIDKVGPWLDLSHTDSSFGTHAPIISSGFSPLRNAILALSAAQASKFKSTAVADSNEFALQILGSDMYSRRAEAIAARSLLELAHLLSHPLHDWRSLLGPHVSYLNDMGVHGFQDDNQRPAAWLTLRFDLAIAINSQLPILTKVSLWQPSLLESPPSAHSATPATFHLEDALLLCAEIADLAFSQSTEGHPTFEIWNSFYTRFQSMRDFPQSELLVPLLSSQIGSINIWKTTSHPLNHSIPSEFPLHIHTSRVSFYSSFLYHLTSLLLLVSQPRNIDRAMSSKLRTTTWHAVQICGLSMSNNVLWSWDPLVVVALLHSGQSLSYGAQQMELLRHLRRLEETTAWKFDGEVDRLEEFWRASS